MANEITDWKEKNCSLILRTADLSARETFSKEINQTYGEGGGLNANYRTVEAVAKVASALGLIGLKYGEDFIFKTAGFDNISFDFCDKEAKAKAEKIFQSK